ncbi:MULTISPECIES: exo-alpha-sialidase [unclassified Lonepinella]|uniref:exo-alpha-sialidase n=2 Tax=Lonepinella TaxID=53416 RepID=UPI0036D8DF5C
MKKLLKKTALSLLISAAISSSVVAADVDSIFTYTGYTPYTSAINVTDVFTAQDENGNNAFSKNSGSLTFRVANTGGDGVYSLLGLSDPTKDNTYISFYLSRKNGKDIYGIEIRDENNGGFLIKNDQIRTDPLDKSTDYSTVTYVFDAENKKISIYVNGEEKKVYSGDVKFLSSIPSLSTAYVGKTDRATGNEYSFVGSVDYAGATSQVLTPEQVKKAYESSLSVADQISIERGYQAQKREGLGAYKTEKNAIYAGTRTVQQDDSNDAYGYRIPALLTTKNGVVIAAADKRYKHWSDWGNIDTVIRRSFDGGTTWEDTKTVINLASQSSYGDYQSAFLIDPLLVQDKNTGRVFMLVDMFPESGGYNSVNKQSGEGSGYVKIGDAYYQELTDTDGQRYTIREGGVVYNANNQPTDYKVVVEGDPSSSFKNLGDIYQGDTRLGNVYLDASSTNTSPLRIKTHSHLWLTYSDNDGETWSSPTDVTHQVKKDWMRFLGTGPGTGIQLQDGSLVMPVYYTNGNGKQSAALIISKDGGKTWTMGESPNDSIYYSSGGSQHISDSSQELTESQVIQLNNGDLKMFSRSYNKYVTISTSHDGGYTWENSAVIDDVLLDPYSQMSVIKYSKLIDGKEYVVFANPHASTRTNGMAWLGEVQENGSIKWKYNTSFEPADDANGQYAYNSLTELSDGSVGILYESKSGWDIQYVRFNLEELFWQGNFIYRDVRDDTHKDVTLNSPREETFYKIGDGEMIKMGKGKNLANLEVREGIATLNQEADDTGAKQAYAQVSVKANGTVRLADSDQLNLSHLLLEKDAILDLNGTDITVNNGTDDTATGLRDANIVGNILNKNVDKEATFTYAVNGKHTFSGLVGDGENGKVNLVYSPEENDAQLTLAGSSFVNLLDVKNGTVTYAAETTHVAEKANVHSNANLVLKDDANVNIGSVVLEDAANLIAEVNKKDGETQLFTKEVSGAGNLIKKGAGTLLLSGNIQHTGNTDLQEGAIELIDNAQLNSTLTLAKGTTLGGQGSINSDSNWVEDSVIYPNFNSAAVTVFNRSADDGEFVGKTLNFGNVDNQGATVSLAVENKGTDMSQWKHDSVNILGRFTTSDPTTVNLYMLGSDGATTEVASDKNGNGQYDADEGLSLIKVYGDVSRIDSFALGTVTDQLKSAYQFELVSFEKGRAGNYYDYQLHRKLITKSGKAIHNVVYAPLPDAPTLEQEELVLTAVPDNAPTLELEELVLTAVPDNAPTLEQEELVLTAVPDNAPTLEQEELVLTAVPDNAPTLEQEELVLTAVPDNAPTLEQEELVLTAVPDNAPTLEQDELVLTAVPETAPTLDLDKELPELIVWKVLAEGLELPDGTVTDGLSGNETSLPEAPASVLAAAAQDAETRYQVVSQVPSYLVANSAAMYQGTTVRDMFTDNLWAKQKKGFYVEQRHTRSDYKTDLGFADYGYNYESIQNTTLFGSYMPVSASTELHAGVAFSNQKVTPKAVDGYSSTKYKTTSLMLAMHNEWNNVLLNTHLGIHWHDGKVSATERNIATIKGEQYQIGAELGYKFKLGQFSITPVAGLSYQHFDMSINDKSSAQLKVNAEPFKVFSQHVGSYFGWENDHIDLNIGALYEHHNDNNKQVVVNGDRFNTGSLDNAVVVKANADFKLTPQFRLGLQVNHRHSVSQSKVKQTNIGAKLEYQF